MCASECTQSCTIKGAGIWNEVRASWPTRTLFLAHWHSQAQHGSRGFSRTTRVLHTGHDLRDPPLHQSHHTDEETEEREVKEVQVPGGPHWGLVVLEQEKGAHIPECSVPPGTCNQGQGRWEDHCGLPSPCLSRAPPLVSLTRTKKNNPNYDPSPCKETGHKQQWPCVGVVVCPQDMGPRVSRSHAHLRWRSP